MYSYSPGNILISVLSLYTEPVYIPVEYSINNLRTNKFLTEYNEKHENVNCDRITYLHQVLPDPGNVYNTGGRRRSLS